jgi:hypothetical protein
MAGKTLPERLKPNDLTYIAARLKPCPDVRPGNPIERAKCLVLPILASFGGNFLPRYDITHSRERKRREFQDGESEMTAIRRELNGNSDGD